MNIELWMLFATGLPSLLVIITGVFFYGSLVERVKQLEIKVTDAGGDIREIRDMVYEWVHPTKHRTPDIGARKQREW